MKINQVTNAQKSRKYLKYISCYVFPLNIFFVEILKVKSLERNADKTFFTPQIRE